MTAKVSAEGLIRSADCMLMGRVLRTAGQIEGRYHAQMPAADSGEVQAMDGTTPTVDMSPDEDGSITPLIWTPRRSSMALDGTALMDVGNADLTPRC